MTQSTRGNLHPVAVSPSLPRPLCRALAPQALADLRGAKIKGRTRPQRRRGGWLRLPRPVVSLRSPWVGQLQLLRDALWRLRVAQAMAGRLCVRSG